MATDPGFHVDPAALRSLAGLLDGHAGQVDASTRRFSAPAQHVEKAFGVVGPSNEVYNQYQQAIASALDGLGKLRKVLEDAATNLRQTADNYERAEHASAGRG